MTAIKTETIRLVRVKATHYILLTVVILAIVILAGVAVANTMQISMLISDTQALQHKFDVLQREQEINRGLIDGQALSKEKNDMITYFKVPPESLFPGDYTPKGIKVKTIVFRDDADVCRIDCISLDRFGKFVCYEQWSIAGNKKDYKQSLQELRSFAGRPMADGDGAGIFAEYEMQQKKEALQQCQNQEKTLFYRDWTQ